MKNFEIKIDRIHKKMFGHTWQYDKKILKRFCVIVKVLYLPGGGKFNANKYVQAFSHQEACKMAYDKINLRKEDKILYMNPVATGTVSK